MTKLAERLNHLGTETAFSVLARANKLAAEGRSIINLGIGQPDFRTPDNIVEAAVKAHHPPSAGGRQVRIKYASQVRESPPVFAFFCNHPKDVKESYRRYLENRLRDAFGFEGVPLTLSFKQK